MEVEAEAAGDGGEGVEGEVELGVFGGGEAGFALVLVTDVGVFFDLAGAELEEVEDDLEGAEGFAIEGGGVESGLARELGLGEEPVAPVVAFGIGDGEGGWAFLGFGAGLARRRAGLGFLLFMASEKGIRGRLKQKGGLEGKKKVRKGWGGRRRFRGGRWRVSNSRFSPSFAQKPTFLWLCAPMCGKSKTIN